MSANEVTEKILAQANDKANEIRANADEKAANIIKKTDRQIDDFNKETTALEKKAYDEAKSRILAAARMANNKKLLKIKKNILNDIFKKAAENIQNLNDDDYTSLMTDLLKTCVETGNEKIIVGKNDGRLNENFIKKVNDELNDKGNLTIAEEKADINAGFILLRGNVRVNASLEVMTEQAKENLEIELAAELYPLRS